MRRFRLVGASDCDHIRLISLPRHKLQPRELLFPIAPSLHPPGSRLSGGAFVEGVQIRL
jgi:hypothetical protein